MKKSQIFNDKFNKNTFLDKIKKLTKMKPKFLAKSD